MTIEVVADKEWQAKYLLDETTFMLFDLERGNHIKQVTEEVHIDDVFKFTYKRVLVEETIVDGMRNIVSNFFIKVIHNDKIIMDYDVYGADRKFRIKTLEGPQAGLFLNVLDQYRKKLFGIE
ncbi:hypothetical protein Xoosp13_362 [Xanthomonas phage Xoo-sp13]|nr:hypothetical protein Xoosp13_362 [Xanthomonas phage Xoo-sp13]